MEVRISKRGIVRVLAVCSLALAGGVAYATVPDGGGVIHGCYTTMLNQGQLRVIDTGKGQACKPGEQALNWSQTGPLEATGPTGPAGTAGPTSYDTGGLHLESTTAFPLVSHTVTAPEAGLTIITAPIRYSDDDGTTGGVTTAACALLINGSGSESSARLSDNGTALGDTTSETLIEREPLDVGDVVSVECRNWSGDDEEVTAFAQLLLMRVNS